MAVGIVEKPGGVHLLEASWSGGRTGNGLGTDHKVTRTEHKESRSLGQDEVTDREKRR